MMMLEKYSIPSRRHATLEIKYNLNLYCLF